jgi:hypothetical protein
MPVVVKLRHPVVPHDKFEVFIAIATLLRSERWLGSITLFEKQIRRLIPAQCIMTWLPDRQSAIG